MICIVDRIEETTAVCQREDPLCLYSPAVLSASGRKGGRCPPGRKRSFQN